MINQSLLNKVIEYFPLSGIPAAANIVDDIPEDLERQEIKKMFGGRTWDDIPDAALRYHAEALFFFLPNAWVYYIPAFLSFMLRDIERCDYVSEAVLGSFVRHAEEYRSLLTGLQRKVIADVLRWVLKQFPNDPQPPLLQEVVQRFEES